MAGIFQNVYDIFSDYKSDSEIYTEPKGVGKKSRTDSKSEKYKKINLDEK